MKNEVKPFLKWAGGKTQLIEKLISKLPNEVLRNKKIKRYIEPFVGGGSFYFYLKNNFEIKDSYISDINKDLILSYIVIRDNVNKLCEILESIQNKYLILNDIQRANFYYEIRKNFNDKKEYEIERVKTDFKVERTAQLIFMNKTCFNGLFRQNKKGEFNVPHGKYKNPKIFDAVNLFAVSDALKDTIIRHADFSDSDNFAIKGSLIYLDPPYRPINNTSSFTSYAKENFNDDDQKRLAKYYSRLSNRGCYLILSNSDPKNVNSNDHFFDNLYNDFKITRVAAKRSINSNPDKRGNIFELMITNYGFEG